MASQSTIALPPCPLAQTRTNINSGCWENGIILQDRPKGCVMVDHKGDTNENLHPTISYKQGVPCLWRGVINACMVPTI